MCGQSTDRLHDAIIQDWSDEETDNPRDDGARVDRLLYADLERARQIFANAVQFRPRIRLTIKQRTRVLQQWPAIDLVLE
jgi:hypothetical protein